MHETGRELVPRARTLRPVIRQSARARAALTTVHHHPLNGRRRRDDDVLANPHRVTLTVDVELQLFPEANETTFEPAALRDRLELWLQDQYSVNAEGATCASVARAVLDQLRAWHGDNRGYRVEVFEGHDLGASCELPWRAGPGRHPAPIVPE